MIKVKIEYVLPLCKISLRLGNAITFNIYEEWGENVTYEIYEVRKLHNFNGKKRYVVLINPGTTEVEIPDDYKGFINIDTERYLFQAKYIEHAVGTELQKLGPKYKSLEMFVYRQN